MARSYDLRYGPMTNGNPPTTWTTVTIAILKSAIPINGLTPGTTYAFQARAFGHLGHTDWMESATCVST